MLEIATEVIHLNSVRKTGNESEAIQASVNHLEETQYDFKKDVEYFIRDSSSLQLFHVGTNTGSQNSILNIRDTANPLAQATHEFFQEKLAFDKSHPARLFATKWLEVFGLGNDIKIEQIGGEAYIIEVGDSDSWQGLSDMGMGAQQVVLLLLRFAAIIAQTKDKNLHNSPTVLIEEPEVNMHPSFQSKLADLFYEVQKDYKLQLIIETHSEYIIRKTQLIGLKNGLFEEKAINPFKVYYFDKVNGPYEMKYLPDGKFDQKFGQGFFDVADTLAMEAFKLNLKQQS